MNTQNSTDVFVFDMDNTLIKTDKANNLAYADAISLVLGVKCDIGNGDRFTRNRLKAIFPNLTDAQFSEIIACKEKFFKSHLGETELKKNDFRFKRTGNEQNVGSIPVAHKLNAFFNAYLPEEGTLKWSIGTLRRVRNEGEHRCDIIRQEKDENNNLYKFFKYKTFNYVRIDLIKFVRAIEYELKNPGTEEKLMSVIASKLPSACYVLLRGERVLLPNKLFAKVKHLNNGDNIVLTVVGNIINDVSGLSH